MQSVKPILSAVLLALGVTAISTTAVHAKAIETQRHNIELEVVTEGLEYPWGMDFLPDGSVLITEKTGAVVHYHFDKNEKHTLSGVPEVVYAGQGGLLDIVVDPNFAENQWVYLSYAEADPAGGDGQSTAVTRARLDGHKLVDQELIFRVAPKFNSRFHFGSRLVFSPKGHLFITTGDRYHHMDDAQTLDNHDGKIVRIWPDGSVPEDNPFVDQAGAMPEIWSYGHRNVQGAAIHPLTGKLWAAEHGPKGGDEINIAEAANNYGWPVATFGIDYDDSIISDKTYVEGTVLPHYYWVPSIAISNMIFYTGDAFPEWKNDLFVAALRGSQVARLDLDGDRVMHEETLLKEDTNARLRDIAQGPDGFIYLLSDDKNGALLRIKPAE